MRVVAGSSVVRLVLGVAIAVAVVVIGVLNWETVAAGGRSLAGADKEWLLLGGLGAVAFWVTGTVTQLGSMPVRLPFARVLAVQVAASFANMVLPAGSGGIGINIRFLRRNGVGSGAAVGAVGLNSLAGLVTHLLLLVVAVVVSPSALHHIQVPVPVPVSWSAWRPVVWALVAVGVAVLVAVPVVLSRARRRRQLAERWAALRVQVRGLWAVARNPYRAAALWLGSISTPLLHALVLFAVLRAVGVGVTVVTVVVVYLVMSALAAVVPSPGGLGALDLMLVAGLATVGIASGVALGAVVGYRLITVWLPLLPGALALAVLVRRRII
jgi:uncharacterized protein (TIRG00374 family)